MTTIRTRTSSVFFLMIRRPPRSTRTDTRLPYTTLFRSWLFAGSDRGGQRTAFMLSLIGTAKLNDIDPQAWLADVLARIADIPQNRLHAQLPWNWRAAEKQRQADCYAVLTEFLPNNSPCRRICFLPSPAVLTSPDKPVSTPIREKWTPTRHQKKNR